MVTSSENPFVKQISEHAIKFSLKFSLGDWLGGNGGIASSLV